MCLSVSQPESNPNIPKHITSDFVVAINICYAGPIARQRQYNMTHTVNCWILYADTLINTTPKILCTAVQPNSNNAALLLFRMKIHSAMAIRTIWHLLCGRRSFVRSTTTPTLAVNFDFFWLLKIRCYCKYSKAFKWIGREREIETYAHDTIRYDTHMCTCGKNTVCKRIAKL